MKHANPYAGLAGSPTPAELEDPSDAVEERGLRDETGFGTPAEAAEPASNPCSWLKRHLRRFTGMDPENLQSYLNPYVCFFRVERDDERWPKIARAVRHLLMAEARFRRRGTFPYHLSG